MPFLQFKGKTAIESYNHTIPHHTIEFEEKFSLCDQKHCAIDEMEADHVVPWSHDGKTMKKNVKCCPSKITEPNPENK